ncbi:MAG: BolA/IbaG family iron-sulfur metabolism protein [Alphaproteobacteria bacterium]|nr:BolA/IbaG family iron-sulfur metabolism protein [Alphaproteobacteria bacterium]
MIKSENVVRLIKGALPDAWIEVEDLRGDGDHFAAYVESGAFNGKTRIEQHRMVYASLQEEMGKSMRSLTLKTAYPSSHEET